MPAEEITYETLKKAIGEQEAREWRAGLGPQWGPMGASSAVLLREIQHWCQGQGERLGASSKLFMATKAVIIFYLFIFFAF